MRALYCKVANCILRLSILVYQHEEAATERSHTSTHLKEVYTHRLPGHADNLNVMEVLASADEAMPALAARLAGADPASAASSASAVTSQTSAPGDLAGEMHEAVDWECCCCNPAYQAKATTAAIASWSACCLQCAAWARAAEMGKCSCDHL